MKAKGVADRIVFLMVDENDFCTPETGKEPVSRISKDGGSFVYTSDYVNEIGWGFYSLYLSATERDADVIAVMATAPGCAQQNLIYYPTYTPAGAGAGAIHWSYTLTNSENPEQPIADVDVWVSSDLSGENVIATGRTDAYGVVWFWLDVGQVYVWRQKSGWDFDNPDTETVTELGG